MEEHGVPPVHSLPKKSTTASGTSAGSSSSELDPGELLQGWIKLGGNLGEDIGPRSMPGHGRGIPRSSRGFWKEREPDDN